jgi:apolipoprotein N-acyltransferase
MNLNWRDRRVLWATLALWLVFTPAVGWIFKTIGFVFGLVNWAGVAIVILVTICGFVYRFLRSNSDRSSDLN